MPSPLVVDLSDRDLLRYLQCPHWPYWERYGDKTKRHEGMEAREALLQGTLKNQKKLASDVYGSLSVVQGTADPARIASTNRLMKQGAAVIYQAVLFHEWILGHTTLLVRKESPSSFGDWSYYPVLIKRRHVLRKEDHLQVGWQGLLLSQIQGVMPTEAYVLGPDKNLIPSDPREAELEVKGVIEELNRIVGGECPEPTLRKACVDISPWGECCLALAEQSRDIALLFQVNRRQREALRQAGIQTVEDAAAIDPVQLSGTDPKLTLKTLQAVQRQARSLIDTSVIVRRPFAEEKAEYEIHFDIESYPATDTDYLFGCLVRDRSKNEEIYVSFVAKKLTDEKRLWVSFLKWIETLPETYTVYHYSPYEYERLAILANRYKTEENEALQRFMDSMVDLNELIKDHAVFPLYVYSLKNIGRLLGATWDGEVTHGADSVQVYEHWLKMKQSADLENLIRYNEADVRATATVLDWLFAYAKQEGMYQAPFPWNSKIG